VASVTAPAVAASSTAPNSQEPGSRVA
jgi:hypothetical protein